METKKLLTRNLRHTAIGVSLVTWMMRRFLHRISPEQLFNLPEASSRILIPTALVHSEVGGVHASSCYQQRRHQHKKYHCRCADWPPHYQSVSNLAVVLCTRLVRWCRTDTFMGQQSNTPISWLGLVLGWLLGRGRQLIRPEFCLTKGGREGGVIGGW